MNQNHLQPPQSQFSRRSLLLAGLGTAMSLPFLSACAGFDTSGAAAGAGGVGFLSTQFTPVEEKQRYEAVLKKFIKVPVAYNSVANNVFASTVQSQSEAAMSAFLSSAVSTATSHRSQSHSMMWTPSFGTSQAAASARTFWS